MITALRHRYLFVFPLSAAGSHLPRPFRLMGTTPLYVHLLASLVRFFYFFCNLFVYRFAFVERFWLSYTMHNVVVIIATLCILLRIPPLSTIFVNVHFSFFLLVSSTPKFANFVDRDMSVISPSVCTLHAIFYLFFIIFLFY